MILGGINCGSDAAGMTKKVPPQSVHPSARANDGRECIIHFGISCRPGKWQKKEKILWRRRKRRWRSLSPLRRRVNREGIQFHCNTMMVDIENKPQAKEYIYHGFASTVIFNLSLKCEAILQLNDVNTSIEPTHPQAGVILGRLELHPLFTAAAAAPSLALLADVRPGLPHQQKIVALAQTRCVSARPKQHN